VRDWVDRETGFEQEVGGLFPTGRGVENKETVIVGLDHAVHAFLGLFAGKNTGKMVVKLASAVLPPVW
ncbi:MAG: hypothetical protein ABIQ12_01790, partial [Opitutaceae bacterium]